ncbi:MAG: transcription antitermination factor NusB [Verrucomicrobia bacterium GWF2_51_19]|nr:MAG: transcription antitermination factor NusB [Verrucomicrobia bacterium GWF2_51_19]HCJ12235.1 transcription antitermination factor NusB [Opitutae bacterium]
MKEEPKSSMRRENRQAVIEFLYMWELNPQKNLPKAMDAFFAEKEKPRSHFAFAGELIDGILLFIDEIDAEIKQYAENWKFDRIAKIDLSILRLAIFELLHREDIPPVVSINEAIELGKLYSIPDSKRFINGILDKFKDKLNRPLR